MLNEAFKHASEAIMSPNTTHEEFRRKWYENVRATKEALKELHTSNEVEFISVN